MKLLTHIVFCAGVVVALFPSLPVVTRFSLAVVASFLVNLLIVEFGHTMHGRFVARSPLTHSVFTAPAWGGAVGYLVWMGFGSLRLVGGGMEVTFVAAGVLVAISHLFLDSLTERGSYFLTGRVALAHFRSGNGLLNGVFLLGGLALLLV